MTTREVLTNVTIIVALMGLFALIETIVPFFARAEARTGRGSANLGLTVLTFVSNWGLTSAAALVALGASRHGIGLATNLEPTMPTQIAFSIVVLDFSSYIAHRSMHAVPLLWRMHQVHHSDPFVDVSTTYRQHPLEGVWRFVWTIGPAWTLGLPATGIVVYRLVSAVNAILEHANIRVWRPLDGILSLLWVTPNMHKVHHSREGTETDSNYGNIFAIYDRVLGTFTRTDRAFEVAYGLDGVDSRCATSFFGLLSLPFRRERSPAILGASGRVSSACRSE
jgi:sterol desaturase/sphingolipid hydroxylase (fatty acid hydroxylase superfamily)